TDSSSPASFSWIFRSLSIDKNAFMSGELNFDLVIAVLICYQGQLQPSVVINFLCQLFYCRIQEYLAYIQLHIPFFPHPGDQYCCGKTMATKLEEVIFYTGLAHRQDLLPDGCQLFL